MADYSKHYYKIYNKKYYTLHPYELSIDPAETIEDVNLYDLETQKKELLKCVDSFEYSEFEGFAAGNSSLIWPWPFCKTFASITFTASHYRYFKCRISVAIVSCSTAYRWLSSSSILFSQNE